MLNLLRNILAFFAAMIAGSVVMGLVEMVGDRLITPPAIKTGIAEAMQSGDQTQLRELISQLPLASFLFVVGAWFCGTLLAAVTVTWLAVGAARRWLAYLVGGLFLVGGIAMVSQIPHPLGIAIVGLGQFLPTAWLGQRLVTGRGGSPATTSSAG